MRPARLIAVFLAISVVLFSCEGPESVNPLSDPRTARHDTRLEGVWFAQTERGPMYVHCIPADAGMTHIIVVFHKKESAGVIAFRSFPTIIEDAHYMNLRLIEPDTPEPKQAYYLARYDVSKDGVLTVWQMKASEVAQAIADGRLKGKVRRGQIPTHVEITDSAANIVEYIRKADQNKLFESRLALRRIHRALADREAKAGPAESVEKKPRKQQWAAPIEKPGLPNLHRASQDLYRGAQPTAEGMRQLKRMGVKTIVNLRAFHSDRDEAVEIGLAYEHIRMKAWDPEDEEVIRFLRVVTDRDRTPVFVHCQHGADRTGLMCAVYRMAVYGWSKEEAIEEMTQGGFGFHRVWKNLVKYLRKLDVEEIKQKAGIVKQSAVP